MITKKDMDPLRGIMSFFRPFVSSCHCPGGILPFALEGVDPDMEQIPITSQKESYDIKQQTAHY